MHTYFLPRSPSLFWRTARRQFKMASVWISSTRTPTSGPTTPHATRWAPAGRRGGAPAALHAGRAAQTRQGRGVGRIVLIQMSYYYPKSLPSKLERLR